MSGRMEFDLRFPRAREQSAECRDGGAVFRILVLGDFSGRNSQSGAAPRAITSAPLVRVDVDNLPLVMRRLAPRIDVALPRAWPASGVESPSPQRPRTYNGSASTR